MKRHPDADRLGWPSYPHASAYRNPYVKLRRGPRQRGIIPDNPNAQLVIAAVESGKFRNMACIAEEIGISRERVRQILNATGYKEFGYRRLRLEWPCPECGETINLSRRELERTTHMPAHCRKCAGNFCNRGHLRSENTRRDGTCRPCEQIRARRVVEVRTCLACGKELPISQAASYQIKGGRGRGDFHKNCYYANRHLADPEGGWGRQPVGTVGSQIDERIKELVMSPTQFADYCGISLNMLSDFRAGLSGLEARTALKVARGLGITVDELIESLAAPAGAG